MLANLSCGSIMTTHFIVASGAYVGICNGEIVRRASNHRPHTVIVRDFNSVNERDLVERFEAAGIAVSTAAIRSTTDASDHMVDPAFRLECRMADVDLLITAGATPDAFFSDASPRGIAYSVFETPDFSVLDRWRLVLNREARPYRYFACLDGNARELGRSRSPEWA